MVNFQKFNFENDKEKEQLAGFPPIREFRENFETFSSQGNQGKWGVFSQNQGKNFEIRELLFQNHFQPFKHFNPRKKTFLSGEVLVLGSVSVIN